MNTLFIYNFRVCLFFVLALFLTGCGGGGGSGGGSAGGTVISGIASKGPLNGSVIKIYQLNADGTQGAQLGTDTSTNPDGSYQVNIGNYSGPILVVASHGTYVDEATGALTSLATPLRTALPNVSGNATVAVTAMTEMAVTLAETGGKMTPVRIADAQNQVEQNLANGINIVSTLPADVSKPLAGASDTQKEYGILLAAVSQHAESIKIANSKPKQDVAGAIADLAKLASSEVDTATKDVIKQKLRTDIYNSVKSESNKSDISDESKLGVFINVGGSSSGSSTGSNSGSSSVPGTFTLLAWNDLGMHCVDGKDYSIFSILPPFNNLHAQLVNSTTGALVSAASGVTLTYEAVADVAGSINTTSFAKTNFWTWAMSLYNKLFSLVSLSNDIGLTGNMTPTLTPKPLAYNGTNNWFETVGIPVTPYDDNGVKNFYPMVKVVAKDASNKVIATARTVLPVSDEMSCKSCHASNSVVAAKPAAGWVNDPNVEIDWKKNIVSLHDDKQLSSNIFITALAKYGYDSGGLYKTVLAGKPVLCANCHSSNALPGTGVVGISSLTQAMHSRHATVTDPTPGVSQGTKLDDSSNRTACYLCHPGSVTKCLRGAMGKAVAANGDMLMGCQSCHGKMSAVGSPSRTGWLQEPNCQSCHHDGLRLTNALNASGVPVTTSDPRFATNADTPAAGFSLYRFSTGHGKLQCEACHGATHAEYPSSHVNDNVLSMDIQGHTGTIAECNSCHKTVPSTLAGGPHGMHTIGSAWVSLHKSYARSNLASCQYCHGANYRGTALSQVKMAKSFSVEGRTISFAAGQAVTCYDCHNGPNGG